MLKIPYLLIIILIAAGPVDSLSQTELIIANYKAKRGEIVRVALDSKLGSIADSVRVSLYFDGLMLGIHDIISGDGYIVNSTSNITKYWDSNESSWVVSISSFDLKAQSSGELIAIDFEVMAGERKFAFIKPFKLVVDGVEQTAKFSAGGIEIQDPAVVTKYTELLEQNYPNPFITTTVFPFSLDIETTVKFSIYDIRGRQVIDWNYILEHSRLFKGEVGFIDLNKDRLGKGEYYLEFNLQPWQLATGMYILVMETERQVHKLNIMVLR